MQFKCSNCSQILEIANDQAGRQALCPFCNQTIPVPPLPPPRSETKLLLLAALTTAALSTALVLVGMYIIRQRATPPGSRQGSNATNPQPLAASTQPKGNSILIIPPRRSERIVARLGEQDHPFGYTVSENCAHVAWFQSQTSVRTSTTITGLGRREGWESTTGADIQAVIDGDIKGRWAEVSMLIFSPDGAHYAFAVGDKTTWRVYSDGHEGPPFSAVGAIKFSPDGHSLAYVAQTTDNTCRVVVNGRTLPSFQWITYKSLQFSPNGRRLTYRAKNSDREVFVVHFRGDAKTSTNSAGALYFGKTEQFADRPMVTIVPEETVSLVSPSLTFSSDGLRFAYVVRDEQGFHCIESLERSPFVTYTISANKGDELELHGVDQSPASFKSIDVDSLVFSPDSEHIAFAAGTDERCFVVDRRYFLTGHKPLGPFYCRTNVIGVARDNSSGGQESLVIDGPTSNAFKRILKLYPDHASGQIAAAVVNDDDTQGVWTDKSGLTGHYERIIDDSVRFSRGGHHLAFAARKGERDVVVLDGKEITDQPGIGIGTIHFIAASDVVLWGGGDVTAEYFGVMDQVPKKYTRIVGGKLWGADRGLVRYAAIQERTVLIVEETFLDSTE